MKNKGVKALNLFIGLSCFTITHVHVYDQLHGGIGVGLSVCVCDQSAESVI